MNNVLSFYFDGTIVQAVKVRIVKGLATIDDARTFLFSDLEDYLSTCKGKRCVISCNPQQFYQDIVHLPPAATKFHSKLVRSEIQKNHPELLSPSIFFRTVGESIIGTKTYSKIAVFSYPDEFLYDFISVLSRFGIRVTRIYAAPYSIFRLALSTSGAEPGKPRIFIATIPGEKLLLVGENNELEFIRKIPSPDSSMHQEDAYNINMTIDYCFQSLRVHPFETVIINPAELPEEIIPLVSVPLRTALPTKLEHIPSHLVHDYLAPLATAFHHAEAPQIGNILPAEYATFALHRKLFTAAAIVLFILTVLLAGYLVPVQMAISELNSKTNKIRAEISRAAAELAAFKKLDAEVNQLKQPIELANTQNSSLNPAVALAALALPASEDYQVKTVSVNRNGVNFNVKIAGSINATSFSETQAVFEKFVADVAKLPGYSVVTGSVDIRGKIFNIGALYASGGQQTK